MTVLREGNHIQFHAVRIIAGNPVKGVITGINYGEGESINSVVIKLDHDIEGINNLWEAGEERDFNTSLIQKIKIID